MPKKKVACLGALGSAKASFFHPRKPICNYLKHNYDKEMLHNVLIVDKKELRINKKTQMAYECRSTRSKRQICSPSYAATSK
jgi:hypothetical protein